MWEVIRLDAHTYKMPIRNKFGSEVGTKDVTDPPNFVLAEHPSKETAERHLDKNIRMNKKSVKKKEALPLRYAIREKGSLHNEYAKET